MKRRSVLKQIGASVATAAVGVQSAAAYHNGDCHQISDPDCILDSCDDFCPDKCCACACPD